MKPISTIRFQKTSVTLPKVTYRRLTAGRKIFARNGIFYSDQEMYRRLFKHYLKNWHGRGKKTNGLRRYNAKGRDYEIHPLYINQVLHAALWQRAIHSGESLSRILDVAIRVFLPRLLEELLSAVMPTKGRSRNIAYWSIRYARRRHYRDFFIIYDCKTKENNGSVLNYAQEINIISKMDFFNR